MTIINEKKRMFEEHVTDPLVFDPLVFRTNIEYMFREYFNPEIIAKLFMEIFWRSRMEAHRQNVVVDWGNPKFVRIFLDKFREICFPLIFGHVTAKEVVENCL